MARPKKVFSKMIEEAGERVRIYEREAGSVLYREVRSADGTKDRESLKHRDRALAEEQARILARRLAELKMTGHSGNLTMGQLFDQYTLHRSPQLTARRARYVEAVRDLMLRHFGASYNVDDFGPHAAETYLAARRSGTLRRADRRAYDHPRDGTIRNELRALSVVFNWAMGFRLNGRRLLSVKPMAGVKLPAEKNPARPRAGQARYDALLAVANEVEPSGFLRLALVLAWHTGRRINSICHLRRSDLLLNKTELRRALAAAGQDEATADHWQDGIRWVPGWDKGSYLSFSPVNAVVRAELGAYLRRHALVGDAWLFPFHLDPSQPTPKATAGYYLTKAEKRAGLPHLYRGGWHAFRRGWATMRKHMPRQDVMQAAGWRDHRALETAYQSADAETMRAVVEFGT